MEAIQTEKHGKPVAIGSGPEKGDKFRSTAANPPNLYRIIEVGDGGVTAIKINWRGKQLEEQRAYTFEELAFMGAAFVGYEMAPADADCFVPAHTLGALERYIFRGGGVSDFLYAMLTNDLGGCVAHGDSMNLDAIVTIYRYLYNRCPSTCFGSKEAVERWLDDEEFRERNVRGYYF